MKTKDRKGKNIPACGFESLYGKGPRLKRSISADKHFWLLLVLQK